MKKIFLLSAFIIVAVFGYAQDKGFNYKALITENGNPLPNHNVTIRFTILLNNTTTLYCEEVRSATDENGIVTTTIGSGAPVTGDFQAIDWSAGDHYLKVEIDTGNGFADFGTKRLESMPYAKFADKADSVKHVDYSDISNPPVTFYLMNTTEPPESISDWMYHLGQTVIGNDTIGKYNPRFSVIESNWGYSGDTLVSLLNQTSGIGDADRIIFLNKYSDNTNGSVTGILNNIECKNTQGNMTGIENHIKGKTDKERCGIRNIMDVTGSGKIYGVKNSMSASGNSQTVIGNFNDLQSNNSYSAKMYGIKNKLTTESNEENACIYNQLALSNNSQENYAIKNLLIPSGGDAACYGVYTVMNSLIGTASSNGDKYCSYNFIPSFMKGTHYGIYADVQKGGSYAGYFKGDVEVTRKLKAEDSGDADMKAYVYGFTIANGTLQTDRSSDGFTLSKTGTGVYKITLTKLGTDNYHYVVNVSSEYGVNGLVMAMTDYAGEGQENSFYIRTFKPDGTPVDCSFHFVVYKK
jgi:hypothetical protein